MAITIGASRQALADTYTGLGTWFSIHTADPGTTGANEAAYSSGGRQQTTWGTGANGVTLGSQMAFSLPAATYTYGGHWNASTAGIFRNGVPITSTQLPVAGQILATPSITVT